MTWAAPKPLTQAQIDALRQPTFVQLKKLGMPSLAQLDAGLKLIQKDWPIHAWIIRRRLKWLVKTMNKKYGVEWSAPWDKQK